MKKRPLLHKILLLPLSKIYGMVTSVRNKMFDLGILKQREFDVPVIVVEIGRAHVELQSQR